jgi:hypothetical protein
MRNKIRENWMLGFLGLLSIRAIPAIVVGDWMNASWILWAIWFIYFIPVKR